MTKELEALKCYRESSSYPGVNVYADDYLDVGKEGVVERSCVDPYGDIQLWGTWGGIALYPRVDKFEVIE